MSPSPNDRRSLLFVSSIRLPEDSDPTARKKWSGLADRFDVYVIGFSDEGFARKSIHGCQFYGLPGNLWFPLRVLCYYLMTPLITLHLTLRYGTNNWTAQGPYEAMSVWLLRYLLKPLVDPALIIEVHGDWIRSFVQIRNVPFENAVLSLLQSISPLLLFPADGFRSVSDETKSLVKRHASGDRPHRTWPGFTNLELFLETTLEQKKRRETDRILYAGALTDLKGIPQLLEATRIASEKVPEMALRLCGPGKQGPYRQQASDLGIEDRVTFRGEVSQEELRDEFLAARLLVLPSRTEGLPRVLLESLACYTPFVATDTPGSKQIRRESDAGRIVPRGDPSRLASAMLDLFQSEDDRRNLGQLGRTYVEDTYSTDRFFEEYDQLVEQVNT